MVGEWPNKTAAQHVNKVFASEGHVCTTEGAQTISLQVYMHAQGPALSERTKLRHTHDVLAWLGQTRDVTPQPQRS